MESATAKPRPQLPQEEAARLAEEDAARASAERAGDQLVDEAADLLDEIDALLEEQSVLTNFRQKGGQ